MVSKNRKHLDTIRNLSEKQLLKNDFNLVLFIQPQKIAEVLESVQIKPDKKQEVVKGFRITTEFEQSKISSPVNIREHIAKLLYKRK